MDSDGKMTKRQLLQDLARLRERIADLETWIADHNQTEEETHPSESRYRRVFESARHGIVILDGDTGEVTDINPFLIEMLGFSREELLGRRLWEIDPFKHVDSSKAIMDELLSNGYVHFEDLQLATKNGQQCDVEFVGNIYLVNNKRLIQCNIRDTTERRKAEERLKYLSTHDELTGLHSRMFFDEEMSRLSRGRQFPITFIIADVDGLKQVNDRLGHGAGDELLRRAASVLKETFRADEVVARIGGDEFIAMLPKTDANTAQMALDRARNKLHSHNDAHTGLPLSFSIGAATANTSQSMGEALRQADEHMYREKVVHKLEGLNFMPREPQLIFKQIEAKLSESPGIHISRLASELACERHVIERAVKVATSMQFREYQQMRRVETALHLVLAEKPLLIKEIAGALGYTSPTSLWRLFKTRMSQSPSDIRALRKKISASKLTNVESFSAFESGPSPKSPSD